MTEPNTPASYADALLTTLAKVPPMPVVITPGPGVPALLPLTSDPTEQEWVHSLPFDYESLDGTRVLSIILTFAGYRFWQITPRVHVLNAMLATGKDDLQPCRFHIDRRWRLYGPITVNRVDL
jgi:hypothetical protein